MRKIIALLLLIFSQTFAAEQCQTLFVLQDAGETNALLPVIELYEKNHENFLILTGGTATELLEKKPTLKNKTLTYAELGIVVDKSWKRDQKLSEENLAKIKSTIDATTVVTGVAFELHGQILQSYPHSFAYWDNINLDGTDPYFLTAKKVAKLAHTLMVPCGYFLTEYPEAVVVGQPALEKWKDDLHQIKCEPSSLLVFIGGYGEEYNEALSLFLDSAPENYTILLTYHPKMEGKIEKEQLAKRNLPNVHLATCSSMEAIAQADVVVCHQSTVGVQAAIAGKSVIYFVPSSQTYTNLLIEKGAVPKATNGEELKRALETPSSSQDLFELLQLPQGADQRIYKTLHER